MTMLAPPCRPSIQLDPPRAQRTLAVGPSSHPLERAADRLAQSAIGGQATAAHAGDDGRDAAPPIVHNVLSSPGQPLDALTRSRLESRFGHSFRRVPSHADPQAAASAQAVEALAFTVGSHIAFGRGLYAPGTAAGEALLAHELAHTVQHESAIGRPDVVRRRRVPDGAKLSVTIPSGGTDEAAHER